MKYLFIGGPKDGEYIEVKEDLLVVLIAEPLYEKDSNRYYKHDLYALEERLTYIEYDKVVLGVHTHQYYVFLARDGKGDVILRLIDGYKKGQ